MSSAITAAAYNAWREEMFDTDYMIWHDGLDVRGILATEGEERKRALEMLYFGLARADYVAVDVLGLLRETAALPQIRALLPGATGTLRINIALAIHKLAGDISVAPALVEELKATPPTWRLEAARALALFGEHPEVVPALLEVVRDDADYLARLWATRSVCAIARSRSPGIVTPDDEKVRELVGRAADGDSRGARAQRAAAAATLAALFR